MTPRLLWMLGLTLWAFSLMASSVYVLNDYLDRDAINAAYSLRLKHQPVIDVLTAVAGLAAARGGASM
jgi:4-hydroxybenzoate polyprenyltransferase